MDAHFGRLREMLGLPDFALARLNAAGCGGSRAELYDRATWRLVEELYADDFAFVARELPAEAPRLRPRPAAFRPPRLPRAGTMPARAWLALASGETAMEGADAPLASAQAPPPTAARTDRTEAPPAGFQAGGVIANASPDSS